MKYLRLYEELEGDATRLAFESYVDWQMIEDIKELALEYLDIGYLFVLNLAYDDVNGPFFYLRYKHGGFENPYIQRPNGRGCPLFTHWADTYLTYAFSGITRNIDKDKIRYEIGLMGKVKDADFNSDINNKEFISSVKEMYPDANIEVFVVKKPNFTIDTSGSMSDKKFKIK